MKFIRSRFFSNQLSRTLCMFILFYNSSTFAEMNYCVFLFSKPPDETFEKLENSYTYKDHVRGFYFKAVLHDGELKIATKMIDPLREDRSHRSASDLYKDMIQHFGVENILEIQAIWQVGTNLKQFYYNVNILGMDHVDAALNTWSGKMASQHGFTKILGNVEFDDIPFQGEIHFPVMAIFVRPSYRQGWAYSDSLR